MSMELFGRIIFYALSGWIALGIGLLCTTTVVISRDAPLSMRLWAGLHSVFILPWILIRHHRVAGIAVIRPGETLPGQEECECSRCVMMRAIYNECEED